VEGLHALAGVQEDLHWRGVEVAVTNGANKVVVSYGFIGVL
jgi:hypothetical protein